MKGNQPIPRKPKLSSAQIDICMVHMLRDPQTFDYAKQHLKPTDFGFAADARYALVWRAALNAAERNNGTLPQQGLEFAVATELVGLQDKALASGEITPDVAELAESLLVWIFSFDPVNMNPDYYRSMIQDLIIERTIVRDINKEMTVAAEIGRPLDIVKSLETYNRKLQSLLIDHRSAGQTAFPKDFKPKKLGKFSTGLPYLDAFMNGGQAPCEVYVVLGPTGLGKTTIGVMLCVEAARVWNTAKLQGGTDKDHVSCFFSWEQDLERLRLRFWSYAALIDSTRLELFADEQLKLSSAGTYDEYELKLFEKKIKEVTAAGSAYGEKERLEAATRECEDSVRIFDFSGSADNPHLGENGLDDVAAALQAIKKEGKEIGVVVIDYAGIAVRRMIAARGEDYSNMRHYLSNFCNEARFKIANQFNCPVWILQQLNAESNKKNPTAPQHHSYASECGNFAENTWFAFTFSTKDKATNMCQLACTKERRAAGDRPPVVLKIEGNLCRMVDVSQTYMVDTEMKLFRPKLDVSSKATTDDLKAKKKLDEERPGKSEMGEYGG